MKDLKELVKSGADKRDIEKLWANGLMYDGHDLTETYIKYTNDGNGDNYATISPTIVEGWDARSSDINDAQESFMGYIPSEDAFVSGFDSWLHDDEADSTRHCENIVYWRLINGRAVVVGRRRAPRMVYGTGCALEKLEEWHEDLIGIRYD